MKRITCLFSLVVAPALLGAAEPWVPYTAHYEETATVRDSNGVVNQTRKEFVEYRTSDGSTARFRQVGGTTVSGRIWLACGDIIDLDYNRKLAIGSSLPHTPREHFQLHKNWPTLGVTTMAGLTVTGWPAHVSNGKGEMWFDVADDILVKAESHTQNPNGVMVDSLKELKSIDLTSAVDESKIQLPSGFRRDSSTQQTCSSIGN